MNGPPPGTSRLSGPNTGVVYETSSHPLLTALARAAAEAARTYSTPLPTVNDKDVALLRQDLRAKAKELISKNMQLTDAEAAGFWPLYDQYAAQVHKVNDTRFDLIKHSADIFKTMTAGQADSPAKLLGRLI